MDNTFLHKFLQKTTNTLLQEFKYKEYILVKKKNVYIYNTTGITFLASTIDKKKYQNGIVNF